MIWKLAFLSQVRSLVRVNNENTYYDLTNIIL